LLPNNYHYKKNTFSGNRYLDCAQDPTSACLVFYPYTRPHALISTLFSLTKCFHFSPKALSALFLLAESLSGYKVSKHPAEGKGRDLRVMQEEESTAKGFWALTTAGRSGNCPTSSPL